MTMNDANNMNTIKCPRLVDATGHMEEFTNDLSYIAKTEEYSYLLDNGLPKIGTKISPGMLLIGKIGQKSIEARDSLNEVQRYAATESKLNDYYNNWLYDGSE